MVVEAVVRVCFRCAIPDQMAAPRAHKEMKIGDNANEMTAIGDQVAISASMILSPWF